MIPYVRDITFEYGRPDQVSPLIRRVIADNPGPFTFTGTGTYIVGRDEVCVIDPGPDLPEHLDAILAATAGERIARIVTTHTHADHSPLAVPLAKITGATIHGLPAPHGPEDEVVRLDEAHDEAFRPDFRPADGDRVSGPGWTLEALLTPGHASNHVCYALLEENALFSGDHIMGWSTTIVSPPDGDMDAYFASLAKVRARGFQTLWPTHGPPITEVEPFLDAYRAHRLDRERQIFEQLAKGRTRIRDMIPEMYAAVDSRLWPAAAHSVLAHMIRLVRAGTLVTEGEPGPDSDYRLADGASR